MIALILSFVILFGFSYFFPQARPAPDTNTTAAKTQAAASSASASPAAPAEHSAAAAATPDPATPQSSPAATSAPLVTIHAPDFDWSIDFLGRIQSAKLLEKKYQTEEGKPLELFDPKKVKPLELRFADTAINAEAFKTPYTT